MKKRKTYEISVIDKTYSKTISDETKFYTSDTALELGFELKETDYNFESAEIVLLNIDDRSLVTRPVSKVNNDFVYEIDDDIVAHYGEWRGQLRFEQAGEIYVSSPVKFRIENDLSNDRPPQLSDVQSWVSLKRYADSLTEELKQAVLSVEVMEDTLNENETARQSQFDSAEQSRQTTFKTAESERDATFENNEATRQTALTEALVKVNDLEANYAPRLNEVTAQLAQTERDKVDKNGSMQVNYANLSQDVREKFTDGAVAVVGTHGVGEVNLTPNSVTEEKVSFIKKSTNLLDINNVVMDKVISGTGTITDNTSYVYSHRMDVTPLVSIFTQNVTNISFYDSSDNFISRANPTNSMFHAPANAYFMRANMSKTFFNNFNMLKQVSIGDSEVPYEPFYRKMEGVEVEANLSTDFKITPAQAEFITTSTNLFNKNSVIKDKVISSSGVLTDNLGYYTSKRKIKVKPGEEYTFYNILYISQFGRDNLFLRRQTVTDITTPFVFVVPADVAEISVSLNVRSPSIRLEDAQINKGNVLLDYEEGGARFNELVNFKESINDLRMDNWEEEHSIVTSDNFNHVYTAPILEGKESTSIDPLIDYKTADFYDLFDQLVIDYPDYVARTLLGYDASDTLPIYRYDFKPKEVSTSTSGGDVDLDETKFPKVILLSGSHGEFASAYLTYESMKQICKSWEDSDALESLRWNVHFIVVPAWSPWSFDNRSRHNFNDISPSRNFPYLFTFIDQESAKSGTTPLTEPETIYIYDLLQENKDALAVIDFHNFGTPTNFIWALTTSKQMLAIAKAHIRQMTAKWKKDYDLVAKSDKNNGYVGYAYTNIYTSALSQAESMGIRGATYEVNMFDEWDENGTAYTSRSLTLGLEAFVNYLLLVTKSTIEEKNKMY